MISKIHNLILLLVLAVLAVPAFAKVNFYVSTAGSDQNPGTLAKPFATLERARDAIRELKKQGQLPSNGVTVILRGGQYFLDRRFELSWQDSGLPNSPVVYRAYKNETPVLRGDRIVTGWKKLGETPAYIDPKAKGKLWCCDIEKGWRPHFLVVNGNAQKLSSYPNEGFFEGDEGIVKFGNPGPDGQRIWFPEHVKPYLEHLPDNGDLEMSWIPIIWANGISVLRDIDVESGHAQRHSRNVLYKGSPKKDWMRGNRFKLINALAFIDQPGEWCVDSEQGRIYLWPEENGFDTAEVYASRLYELIRIEGDEERGRLVHDVTFEGFELRGTDRMPEDQWPEDWLVRNFENPDAAIYISGAEDITIRDNRIVHVGTYGVTLNHHAQRIRVEGNEIAHTGSGGIQLFGYGPGTLDVNKNNVIRRNVIHHCGANDYMHSSGISIYQSGSNKITHNFIYETPFSAVMMVGAHYTHINDAAKFGWSPEDDWVAGHTDAYGNYENQYQVRWDELPEGSRRRMLEHRGVFTHLEFMKYTHARDNWIAYNIVSRNMLGLADGGALNTFALGADNHISHNIIHQSKDKTIYLDTGSDLTYLEGNCGYGIGGTINTPVDCRNLWKDNRFDWNERPGGYNELLHRIYSEAAAQSGWKGEVPLEKPTLAIDCEGGKLFFDQKRVVIQKLTPSGTIHYTLDGTEPTADSKVYRDPFEVDATTEIRAAVYRDGKRIGPQDRITFRKVDRPIVPDVPLNRDVLLNKVNHATRRLSYRFISYNADQFQVQGTKFHKGYELFKHDHIIIPLQPNYRQFVAMIGIDDLSDIRGHIVFEILIDGQQVFQSDKMSVEDDPYNIAIDIPEGSKELVLKAKEFSNFYWVWGDWIHPGFVLRDEK